MGTRADFYVGRGEQSEWLGSIALDGYPDGVKNQLDFTTEAEERYRNQIAALLKADEYATTPNEGWPWPWETSDTTDYAYAFDGGKIWASHFGSAWFDPADEPEDTDDLKGEAASFPNMKDRQEVTLGKRSGLMTFVTPA